MHSIAIHGGAGTLPRADMTPAQEAAYRAGLAAALDAGFAVLDGGGSSLDAVTTAVRILEDDPLFNAGRGAVLTHEATVELDASIMDGRGLAAGAIAGVAHVKNPIGLARAVMEHSAHVMLIGAGAEVLQRVSMVGSDLKLDAGIATCGKEGQSVPVGVGQPTLRIDGMTVGGTAA